MATEKTYRGMIVECHEDGWCWHDGTPDGEYGGYWPTEKECLETIDHYLQHGNWWEKCAS